MIRRLGSADLPRLLATINDGAQAYRGIIPADRFHDPYMSAAELDQEIAHGVEFHGIDEHGTLVAVMGIQHVQDVTLIRHAYVRTTRQKRGLGAQLLAGLRTLAQGPVLIGTWADAAWAIRFYERHGFRLLDPTEKASLLKRYWTVPERQIETSVVLADAR